MKKIYFLHFFAAFLLFSSCKVYNQNLMFKANGDMIYDKVLFAKMNAESNYIIQPYDRLVFKLFSNDGQTMKIIGAFDNYNAPELGLEQQNPNNQQLMLSQNQNPNNVVNFTAFTVQTDGFVYLPMVGEVKLEGLTAHQADSILSQKFNNYYKGSFIRTQFLNKRVIVFKGAKGEVVPLLNENTTLIEILAQTGGMPNDTRAKNIRLIRGDLQNPNVLIIDLSTVEGMKRVNLQLQPNDIIYVEPVRKTFIETISDASPIIGLITSTTSFILTLFLLGR
ncbi:MAG: polysaccharide biosynthesis/export family protein [Thermonemataceae bacterium]|nr:polysaccharide biosynthesis/export family protein [Thermonemataceae bacterium]